MAKKQANGGGSVERRGALWWVMVSLPRVPGEKLRRKRVPIADSEKMSRGEAKREGAKIARDVRDGRIVFDDKPKTSSVLVPTSTMTVRQVGEAWTSGKLCEKYGASVVAPRTKSRYIDGKTLAKHVYKVKTRGPNGPDFGDLPIASVTYDDARSVMGAQRPEEAALESRVKNYGRIHQIFDLAESVLDLRPIGSNPFVSRLRPRKVDGVDIDVSFTYWYPSEAVQFMACTRIVLARRVRDAIAVATGFDASTIPRLTWAGIEGMCLQGFRGKSSKPVFVRARPSWLFDLLDAWRTVSGAPRADAPRDVLQAAPIIPRAMLHEEAGRESERLQEDMTLAKLTRSALFETNEHQHRMRFHDLRATFETWARRDGWDQRDIDARTGHASKEMAERYDRGASSLAELQEAPFPDLARAMPELRAVLQKRPQTPGSKSGPKTPPVAHAVAQNRVSGASSGRRGVRSKTRETTEEVRRRGLEPLRCYPLAPQAGNATMSDVQERENTSATSPLAPLDAPHADVCNEGCNGEQDIRAQIAAAVLAGDDAEASRLMALLSKPTLRLVR